MPTTCPADDALRCYLLGDYSDEQGAEIEKHLSQCAACEQTLASFDDTKDQLLRHLPLAAGTELDDGNDSAQSRPAWLDRLKAGVPASPATDDRQAPVADYTTLSGLDSYELLGILGRGGMGVVYRARHRQLGRSVAIKVVHPKLMSAINARDRFEQEIRILGGMNHPGIVMATDAGRVGSAAYLVMELIEGVDLARLVRELGPLSIPQATELARQIAAALAAAHGANAIHRDVKPSNVMLDRDGRAKLLDFGLAHLSEHANKDHETSLGHVLGTLDYMAPEQAEGKAVGSATDLYALGALLFYLLTGEPPHGASTDRTLLQQLKSITNADTRTLSSLRADIPEGLDRLVAQLLSSDPDHRPADAQFVAATLSQWAEAESLKCLDETIQPDSHDSDYDKDAADRSLCALLGLEPATEQLSNVPPAASEVAPASARSGSSLFKRIGIATAIAACAAAIWFGITIVIQTPTGEIVINSEVAGIEVELLDEKDRPTKMTIENDQEATELKAGKYRIRILGPHDGAELDMETLTLTKGETTIATIRRVPKGETALVDSPVIKEQPSNVQATVDSVPEVSEPVYEGKPYSHWIGLFNTEVKPDLKIAAATNALKLVPGSPAEQVKQQLEILGSLYKAAYGKRLKKLALGDVPKKKQGWNPYYYHPYQPSSNWPELPVRTKPGETGYYEQISGKYVIAGSLSSQLYKLDVLKKSVETQLKDLPTSEVKKQLGEMVADESVATSSFGIMMLNGLKALSYRDWEALGSAPAELRPTCLLLQTDIFESASDQQKTQLIRNLEQEVKKGDSAFITALLQRIGRGKIGEPKYYNGESPVKGFDTKLISELILERLENEEGYRNFFSFTSPRHKLLPFDNDGLQSIRKRSFPLWEDWIDVSNKWLAKNGTRKSFKLTQVLNSYRAVLPTRCETDDWDIKETARLITKQLSAYYQNKEQLPGGVTAHDLLSTLVLCGEPFPEFVVSAPPADPKIRQRLALWKDLMNANLDFDEYRSRGKLLSETERVGKGLIQDAPFHTVKCIINAMDRPFLPSAKVQAWNDGGKRHVKALEPHPLRMEIISLINDASDVNYKRLFELTKNHEIKKIKEFVHKPPVNSLLLLAIVSELSHEHSPKINYSAMRTGEYLFLRHVRDALRCKTVVGSIAKRWARKMYDDAVDEKKKEIESLLPSLKSQ